MRASSARALLPAAVVLALVCVVAVAATGSTPTGTSEGRRPSDTIFDTFFTFGLLLLLPGAALLVYGLLQRKDIAREMASRRYPRTSIVAYLVFVGAFSLFVYFRYRDGLPFREEGEVDLGLLPGALPVPDASAEDQNAYQAEFAWIPVLVVVALAAAALAAYVLASRRRAAPPAGDETVLAEQLADVLDDTLDDLRAEPDPRRAVVAAFARLERALAAVGAPRSHAETADEYVTRVLGLLDVDPEAVGRLTALFVQAKFSQHAIDDRMKTAAIDALEQVRDDLRRAARTAGLGEGGDAVPAAEDRIATT